VSTAPASSPTELRRLCASRQWYHTIELAPGILTPGWFDLRALTHKLAFPESMAGMRCLDIGTFDGFWAFEMERRGAQEVIGLDILDPRAWDWPWGSDDAVVEALEERKDAGRGFNIAREALGMSAMRLEGSVYELDPAVHGTFDFVYLGSLLLHLRDPIGALERVRSVCTGQLLVLDQIHLPLSVTRPRQPAATLDGVGRPWWWRVNLRGLARMVAAAGFTLERRPQPLLMPRGGGQPFPRLTAKAFTTRIGREQLFSAVAGAPHAAVLARPRAA